MGRSHTRRCIHNRGGYVVRVSSTTGDPGIPRMHRCLLLLLLCLFAMPAFAADPCPLLRMQKPVPDVGTRIAAYACEENQAWFRPFNDMDGRPGGLRVYEAETSLLADGVQAWRRVATYWI